jgi:predicted dehydrogenase
MTEPLRYIIVGTGGFGGTWCQEFLPRLATVGKARVVAAVDLDPSALLNAQQYLGLPPERCYADIQRAFDENPADFAIVVVPPASHERVVDVALEHGCNILSEKPMADSMAACARIYHKVHAAGKKMAVTMSHRFDQDKQTLEAAIKSGEYGRLNYLAYRFTCNYRVFGSWGKFRHSIPDALLIDATVHHFDIIRGLTGADGKIVYAQTWNPPWGEFAGDSTGLLTLSMTSGAHVAYEGAMANASHLDGWGRDYIRAECEFGTLELHRRRLRVLRGGPDEAPVEAELPMLEQALWMNYWLADMYCDWLRGGPPPPTHLDDNIQCAALLFASIASAHSGEPVDVQGYLHNHLKTQA